MNYRVRIAKYILTVSILVVVFAIGAGVCVQGRIKQLSLFAQSYPLIRKPSSSEFVALGSKRSVDARKVLSKLGRPDAQTRTINHWRSSVSESIGHTYSPPVWQWWAYQVGGGYSFSSVADAALALFDPPAEQWWYFDHSDKDAHSANWLLVSVGGNIIDRGSELISKSDYPDWKQFLE
ncbi:MAG: hypothetical protein WC028_28690 [Candidatus Obscuribacterales bacterium]